MSRLTHCRRVLSRLIVLAVVLLPAGAAVADDPEVTTDARLENFNAPVKVDGDSTALTWLFFIFLAVVGLSPLFKDAKRSHLD